MLRQAITALMSLSVFLAAPATTLAQSGSASLSELLPHLHRQVIAAEDQSFSSLTSTEPEDIRKARLDTVLQINNLLAIQLSSFPLGSSAGGFTWTFEPVSGAVTRASDSFGPLFAERALTIGKNRLNFGVNYQRVTFDHLDGKNLRGREIANYTGLPEFLGVDGVFFEEALDLQLNTQTISAFATYGVTDRLDVGVAVPIIRVDVKATIVSLYGDTVTGTSKPDRPEATEGCVNYWIPAIREHAENIYDPLPSPVKPHGCGFIAAASGTATGIGDIVVRAKYNVFKGQGGGLAGGVDARLPTGDERNLLGVGGAQTKVYLAASTGLSHLSPHVNVGYTISGKSDAATMANAILAAPPDEINYVGGADVPLSLRTTVAVDVIGRTLRKVGTLEEVPSLFGSRNGDPYGTKRLYQELRLHPGADLHLLLGSAGVKVNPAANLLMSANVLFPLTKSGLTDRLTWMLGFDYSF